MFGSWIGVAIFKEFLSKGSRNWKDKSHTKNGVYILYDYLSYIWGKGKDGELKGVEEGRERGEGGVTK